MCKLPSLKLVHSNPPLGVLKRSVRSDIESGPRLRSGILGACAVAALAAILPSSFWPFDAVWTLTCLHDMKNFFLEAENGFNTNITPKALI